MNNKKNIEGKIDGKDIHEFLEEIKDATESALTTCKNEITSNRPVRELYDSEEEFQEAECKFAIMNIQKMQKACNAVYIELLDLYKNLLKEAKKAKQSVEIDHKFYKNMVEEDVKDIKMMGSFALVTSLLVSEAMPIAATVGGGIAIFDLIMILRILKKVYETDKSISSADKLCTGLTELIEWMTSYNMTLNEYLDWLKCKAISGEDVMDKLLYLSVPVDGKVSLEDNTNNYKYVRKIEGDSYGKRI